MPAMIRIDKGPETGTMATIHAFLRRHHADVIDPVDTILYGPSTSNQVHVTVHNWKSTACLYGFNKANSYLFGWDGSPWWLLLLPLSFYDSRPKAYPWVTFDCHFQNYVNAPWWGSRRSGPSNPGWVGEGVSTLLPEEKKEQKNEQLVYTKFPQYCLGKSYMYAVMAGCYTHCVVARTWRIHITFRSTPLCS